MPQTTNWSLPYPSLADVPNVPLDLQRLATATDHALGQTHHIYPGVQGEDINLVGNAKNLVTWSYSIPSTWQSATILLSWEARQWSNANAHVRTGYRIYHDGNQYGPTVQEGVWVPAGDAGARMITATRIIGNVGGGSHNITITGEVQLGGNNAAYLGNQMWWVLMFRTQ